MRNNAITRIIVYSILTVLLLGILLTGLGIGMFLVNFGSTSSGYTTAQASTILFAPEEVKNIQIEWASGNISIQTGDVSAITVTEEGYFQEYQALSYRQSGSTLNIRYHDASFKLGFFSSTSKDLTVTVPLGWECDTMKISAASAEISATEFSAREVHIDTASGDCSFVSCTFDQLEMDAASGSAYYEGTLNTLECDTASGSFTGTFYNTPGSLEMDTASGDLDITLPEDTGYQVDMDALSGSFSTEFGGSYFYGEGNCRISFDGVSGGIRIRKGK